MKKASPQQINYKLGPLETGFLAAISSSCFHVASLRVLISSPPALGSVLEELGVSVGEGFADVQCGPPHCLAPVGPGVPFESGEEYWEYHLAVLLDEVLNVTTSLFQSNRALSSTCKKKLMPDLLIRGSIQVTMPGFKFFAGSRRWPQPRSNQNSTEMVQMLDHGLNLVSPHHQWPSTFRDKSGS